MNCWCVPLIAAQTAYQVLPSAKINGKAAFDSSNDASFLEEIKITENS